MKYHILVGGKNGLLSCQWLETCVIIEVSWGCYSLSVQGNVNWMETGIITQEPKRISAIADGLYFNGELTYNLKIVS